MRWLKRLLLGIVALILLLVILLAGIVVALNHSAGQKFAVRQINKFGKHYVHLEGMSGSFPADLKLSNLELIDPQGVWLSANQIQLKWSPVSLLRRHLVIESLTAETIDAIRKPDYPPAASQKTSGGISIPHISIALAKLQINHLLISPAIAGQAMTFHVVGHAVLPNLYKATIDFDATTESGIGSYHLAGTLTPQTIALNLAINEKPGGLIGYFIDPKLPQPLSLTATLNGPRNQAKLEALAKFGAAQFTLKGQANLTPAATGADVTLAVPSLAPVGMLAGLSVDGSSILHIVITKNSHSNRTYFIVQDHLTLTKAPKGLEKLLLGQTNINLAGDTRYHRIKLQTLALNSPGFTLAGSGLLSQKQVNLVLDATLPHVADLLPHLRGQLHLQTRLTGPVRDLHVYACLDGQVRSPNMASEPFQLILNANHAPTAPYGTIKATGELVGSPIVLSTRFAYHPKATSWIKINQASWKSIAAEADLRLKAGAKLPTGNGKINISTLADLDDLLGHKYSGMIDARFAYHKNQNLDLVVTAKNTSFDPQITGLNATLSAAGQLQSIAVKLNASAALLLGSPAHAKLAGNLDLPAQAVNLQELTADWHGLAANLQTPAEITLQPDLTIQHLHLTLARADIAIDGHFSPTLAATATIKNFDLAMLRQISPKLNATGIANLTTTLNGTLQAPHGQVTLQASGLRYITPQTAAIPPARLNANALLKSQGADINLTLVAGPQADVKLRGTAPLTLNSPMDLTLNSQVDAAMLSPLLAGDHIKATGMLKLNAHLTGTPHAPLGFITLTANQIHSITGASAFLPPADFNARADVKDQRAKLNITLTAGPDLNLTTAGTVPLIITRPIDLGMTGRVNLQLLNPILAANGNLVHGIVTTNLRLNGPVQSPAINGILNLTNGSFLNVGSGLNLTAINASINTANKLITLKNLSAMAGKGNITGSGTVDLSEPSIPVALKLNAAHATPIASDLLTETLNAALTLNGGLKTGALLAGNIDLLKVNINIPRSLPPTVANLPIHYEGETLIAHQASSSSMAPLNLALKIRAKNQIFIRGEGLFAELGGHINIAGNTTQPVPSGGFSLIRGTFSLTGKTLEFTQGKIEFNGDGFIPVLDLEATSNTSNGGTATLTVSGTAAKPKISLSSSPPLPSDEILAQLLFAQSSTNLSPFQAASLAAALAQISGIGGGFSPLDSTRNVLGLDQLSIGSDNKGAPTVQAGRYVAPGIYVGASQSTTGEGSQANVEINLYKGLKLQSSTGIDSTGQNSSSLGLSYQFNY